MCFAGQGRGARDGAPLAVLHLDQDASHEEREEREERADERLATARAVDEVGEPVVELRMALDRVAGAFEHDTLGG